jgi:molybdenum cofactor synthesis domain-containing protein
VFFFEKKNQKTFVYLRTAVGRSATAQSKVFLLLFLQKKKTPSFLTINALPACFPSPGTAPILPSMNPTACLLVIGNEVLSGRTQDANTQYLARRLGELGIPLREVRVIPGVAETIITTVNEVRARFDHVFTTGGIGPTHDDITSECIAAAFGVPWEPQPTVWARMEAHYQPGDFNAARQRMATMPRGAVLIDNGHIAPGFSIGNVHVMAGVPAIMRLMFEALAPRLRGGLPVVSRSVHAAGVREGDIAASLAEVQNRYPQLDIGSYPYFREKIGSGVAIVAKGTDATAANAAIEEVTTLFRTLGADPLPGEPELGAIT